jgi:sugar lactone lactonase YvrE
MEQLQKLFRTLALASLFIPTQLFAAAGDLYVTSIDEITPTNGEVIAISPNGATRRFAGPVPDPYGIVFDRTGQLLVASDPSNNIYKYAPDTARTTFASGVSGPIGLAFDSLGNLYVASIRSNSIIKFTPDGTRSTLASGIAAPIGIGVDADGNVYTGGLTSGLITKVTPGGTKTTFATGVARPYSIIFDRQGNMLVAERATGVVSKFTPQGAKSTFLSGFSSPFGLLLDSNGNLFISEHDGAQITKVSPEGVRSVFAAQLRSPAFMAIEPAKGSPVNISSRMRVGTNEDILIGGFIVTGTQPKRVIVRAIGPSLPLSGTLSDPVLELRNSSDLIASNDNWRSNQEAEIVTTGLPPGNDLDSAIVATLPANGSAYTAVVSGVNNGTGIGVVEVYDLDSAVDAKLGNISTRGLVQGGDNVLIGGFIVNENGARVVVRAIGPSLLGHGVGNALLDPAVTLFNASGQIVATCNNWREAQESAITQTGLAPENDLEAALVVTLANGAYTAVVSGQNGGTGVGLVEIYSVL